MISGNQTSEVSFPRSAWERGRDGPRPAGIFRVFAAVLPGIGRGASGMHSHAERGNERGISASRHRQSLITTLPRGNRRLAGESVIL